MIQFELETEIEEIFLVCEELNSKNSRIDFYIQFWINTINEDPRINTAEIFRESSLN